MTVNVDLLNNNFNLPVTNSFIVGTGTYSYSSNIIVGMAVEMHGASSGISSGSVVATNQTVFVNNTTVGNLAKSDYTCQAGDSGAGIFSNNAFYVTGYCYGIQSIGVFSYGSTISTYSYFTQY